MNTTKNETKHTPGALRAAQRICAIAYGDPAHPDCGNHAAIIDGETGAQELREALLETASSLGAIIFIARSALSQDIIEDASNCIKQAAAAIAKAQGETKPDGEKEGA